MLSHSFHCSFFGANEATSGGRIQRLRWNPEPTRRNSDSHWTTDNVRLLDCMLCRSYLPRQHYGLLGNARLANNEVITGPIVV
ncbi:TPA: hypothetical protein EYG59_02270 [Candidatus Poribacteria bacterium]|nr:hypothetical protein [Candidatus Poribacteria bacterium]